MSGAAMGRWLMILTGGGLVGFWVIAASFAPYLAPFDPLASLHPLALPGARAENGAIYWMGTDQIGRDVLSRLIYGARTVMIWSGLATGTAYCCGLALGLIAGYYRGWADRLLSFFANVILSFPVLVLYVVIIVSLGASAINIVIAVTFATAPAIFRLVRAVVIDLRQRDFVLAAITQGESDLRIMLVEILPNASGPLIVDLCLRFGYTAITIGALGFLGVGLPPPTPDWGGMINDGRAMAIVFPHLVLFPCLAISSLMIGLSLLADGLKELLQASMGSSV